jgi:hypothetical protein
MRIGRFALPYGGGGAVNPFADYTLLTEFDTNSPNNTTFDPTIGASSGEYAWDLGDGTLIFNDKAISHTYATTATRTVKLYGKGTCNITSLDFNSDNIVGELDLSHDAFITCGAIALYTNAGLTSVIFPTSVTGTITQLHIYSTGITGTLDLSAFSTFTSTATILLNSNASMTGITWASSITGTIAQLVINTTGISGTLDLSKFSSFTTSALISLHTNASMTGITWASSISGTISSLLIHTTGISGTLDLSKFSSFTTSAGISLYSNASMTGITWASSISGTFGVLHIYSTGITGTLDLSKFSSFTTTGDIRLYSNASMTAITWASSITGTFATIYIYSTGITGTLDLSKFTTYTATATVYLNNNTSMTGVTFPASTINGFVRTLRLYSCTSLGYVDLTKLKTGVNSMSWDVKGNGWSAAIVNQVLVNIDGISAAGFTSRSIAIGGTNTDPDTTSGGYNGSAARTSLQGKSFIVTIT